MDQNQYSDAAYEDRAKEQLTKLARDLGFVIGLFLAFCAGYGAALLTF